MYILFQELYMLAVQGWGIDRVWTLGMYLFRNDLTLPETYRVLSWRGYVLFTGGL